MYATDFQLMKHPEVRYMSRARIEKLLPQFQFTRMFFDGGDILCAKGPGVGYLRNDRATYTYGDDFTSAGLLFCKLNEDGLVSEAVLSNLLER